MCMKCVRGCLDMVVVFEDRFFRGTEFVPRKQAKEVGVDVKGRCELKGSIHIVHSG